MTSSPSSPSRLKLDITGYDQVIALSQAHINQTLKHNFTFSNSQLLKFKQYVPDGTSGLVGDLKPPTVAMVDSASGDQALMFLDFKEGKYWYSHIEKASGEMKFDEDGIPIQTESTWKRETLQAKDWRLAFIVKFTLENGPEVPDSVRAVTDTLGRPGDYSIGRLIVDLGDVAHLNLAWAQCQTPNIEAKLQTDARASIELFASRFLTELKKKKDSNILGYVVQANPGVQALNNSASFPPTSLRMQAHNARPDGDATKSTTENGLNALLFTEMTGTNTLPTTHLPWSGDWFYQSIGGTLAMSSGVFWDAFLMPKLEMLNLESLKLMNTLAFAFCDRTQYKKSDMASLPDGLDWVFNKDAAQLLEAVSKTFDRQNRDYTTNRTWEKNFTVTTLRKESNLVGSCEDECLTIGSARNEVVFQAGTGLITIHSTVVAHNIHTMRGKILLGTLVSAQIGIVTTVSWTTTLELRAVENGGRLDVKVTVNDPDINSKTKTFASTSFDGIPVAKQLGEILRDQLELVEKALPDMMMMVLRGFRTAHNVGKELTEVLNGRGRFIFPGGGTFDMKDPIFSSKGDVLLGLSYKQGQDKAA